MFSMLPQLDNQLQQQLQQFQLQQLQRYPLQLQPPAPVMQATYAAPPPPPFRGNSGPNDGHTSDTARSSWRD